MGVTAAEGVVAKKTKEELLDRARVLIERLRAARPAEAVHIVFDLEAVMKELLAMKKAKVESSPESRRG